VLFLETVVSTAKDTEMSVRRRGEAKQANGSANGSIKHEDVIDLKTDHTRWRMKNVDGRQTWHYLESDEELKAWPMTSADKYYLGMDTVGCNIQNLLHNIF
jgi:lanosterol synthase